MKARHRKPRRSRSRFPFFFIGRLGALIAAPRAHAADRLAALPVERRVTIEPERIEAALGHIKIWTPSETLPSFSWQDVPGAGASGSAVAVTDLRHSARPARNGSQGVRGSNRRESRARRGRPEDAAVAAASPDRSLSRRRSPQSSPAPASATGSPIRQRLRSRSASTLIQSRSAARCRASNRRSTPRH